MNLKHLIIKKFRIIMKKLMDNFAYFSTFECEILDKNLLEIKTIYILSKNSIVFFMKGIRL